MLEWGRLWLWVGIKHGIKCEERASGFVRAAREQARAGQHAWKAPMQLGTASS